MFDLLCTVCAWCFLIIGFGVTALCLMVGVIGFIFELNDLVTALIKHVKRWNVWRKKCSNSKFHKLMVLLGLRVSPTMILTLTDEEINSIAMGLDELHTAAYDSAINLVKEIDEDVE